MRKIQMYQQHWTLGLPCGAERQLSRGPPVVRLQFVLAVIAAADMNWLLPPKQKCSQELVWGVSSVAWMRQAVPVCRGVGKTNGS